MSGPGEGQGGADRAGGGEVVDRGHGPVGGGGCDDGGKGLVEHASILSLNLHIQKAAMKEAKETLGLDMVVEKVMTPEEVRNPQNLCRLRT